MNISRNKSEISSWCLANEATVFTVRYVQCGIEQRQTGLGRPGCRPVTPAESRPLVHRRRVGSYFHALDAAFVLLACRWQRNVARINKYSISYRSNRYDNSDCIYDICMFSRQIYFIDIVKCAMRLFRVRETRKEFDSSHQIIKKKNNKGIISLY